MRDDRDKTRRISVEEREEMLDFMKKHPALATGEFTGPDGAKHKPRLLKELASLLNSMPTGVTKSEDKWLKSWHDWRSDVKSKAALLKREQKKAGGGKMCDKAKPLTPLEKQLLVFLGPNVVYGHEEVPDTLQSQNEVTTDGHVDNTQTMRIKVEFVDEIADSIMLPPDGSPLISPVSPSMSVIAGVSHLTAGTHEATQDDDVLVGITKQQLEYKKLNLEAQKERTSVAREAMETQKRIATEQLEIEKRKAAAT